MKRKVISAVLAVTLAFTLAVTSAMPAFATPNEEVIENQKKYDEYTKKIDEITGKIIAFNAEIEPLIEKIDNNNAQMEEIKVEIKNTEVEIESAKEDIAKQEEVLGKRVRELYKSGGQTSYIMLLFSAESFNDLISKIESTNRLVKIDKEIVKELKDKQENLDTKVKSLDEKSKEIQAINEENKKSLADLEEKKAEQQKLADEAAAEQAEFEKEFLVVSERTLVEYQFSVIADSTSSIDSLRSAITQLRSIRDTQIKSSIVVEEINEQIEIAKSRVEELEAKEAASNTIDANRGEISSTGNGIVDFAYQYLGAPYVWGATGPTSFDCSGFTSFVYANAAGIDITRTTYSQMGVGTPVSYSELQPGDLVFTYGGDHVGIYVGGGQYVHAPMPGQGVKVGNITDFYTARRVL
ncbi:NlpC/P60 family protein [Clostridium celatum]|nr:C40 family peptidase [Clostridium celatum]MCE9656425.1 NlpC/P60 family protein [Clostridium celatum]MDU2266353.1 NlpC/P60 family protein [Clostridium celatum]MDU6296584.1 NlpC/P60 family protein [Clostridium celatum]MDY3362289.1 NlpC/P60 family protein [Clostridium celatum]